MIVTRGVGRGPNRGSIAAHGLTRRTRLQIVAEAIKLFVLQPGNAFRTANHTLVHKFKTLIPKNGNT